MEIKHTSVGMLHCREYDRAEIKKKIDRICRALHFTVRSNTEVLVKPNLISGQRKDGLACTHPEFLAALVEWFLDHGARVSIGDSPAFGTARSVMKKCGIINTLRGLPIRFVDFKRVRQVSLAGGVDARIAVAALECDVLVNVPKVKAHSQFLVTLAVKNYFGVVVGMTKPWWHLRHGGNEERFAALLVDLLALLPNGISLVDGVTAMHDSGPLHGGPFSLGIVAGAMNPVALETALLEALGIECQRSILWRECARRGLSGTRSGENIYPLLSPDEMEAHGFRTPQRLKPISFNPFRLMVGGLKRLFSE